MNTNYVSKADLIAALESGKYVQGFGQLRTQDDKFCCLGVYCDLQNPAGWVNNASDEYSAARWEFNSLAAVLNDANDTALRAAGIDTQTMINMNDSRMHSFADIANWLREQPDF